MNNNSSVAALLANIKVFLTQTDSQLSPTRKTFVAFPMPGLPISPQDLEFSLAPNESNLTHDEAITMASNYAHLVNRIPNFSSCWSSDGRLLWQEYQTILTQAVLASSEPSPDEIKKFENASNFIHQKREITDLLGKRTTIVDSSFLAAYKQYQQVFVQAESEYNTLQEAARNSTDLETQQKWELNKPIYQRRVETARKNWITKGYKNQVDKALAFIDQIGNRNPQLLWKKWTEKFELSKLTDLEDKDFYSTYFYPSSFYQLGAQDYWQQLSLDFRALETLDSQTFTTEELDPGDESSTNPLKVDLLISKLTVELIQVQVVRPWMSSNIFNSRFWQWLDIKEPLSDGYESPKGSLPAYVTSMVVARNLNIELVSDSEQNTAAMQDIEAGKSVYWGPFSLENATVSGSNLIQLDGMQIVAFVCEKLPKSPNPNPKLTWPPEVSEDIVVNWLEGEYKFNSNAKITQIRVTIHTGKIPPTDTEANVEIPINNFAAEVSSPVQFRINQGNWWSLENPQYPNPENADTATYGPFNAEGLTVKNISQVPIEFQPDTSFPLWVSQIEWLRLEVHVEEYGWLAYKQWQPGWLDSSTETSYSQLQ